MIKLSTFLMEYCPFNKYGHKDTEIRGLSVEQGLEICKELNEEYPHTSFVLELWTDGGYNLYMKDYNGHKDILILSVEP